MAELYYRYQILTYLDSSRQFELVDANGRKHTYENSHSCYDIERQYHDSIPPKKVDEIVYKLLRLGYIKRTDISEDDFSITEKGTKLLTDDRELLSN